MKRLIGWAVVFTILAFLFSGCGQSSEEKQKQPQPRLDSPVAAMEARGYVVTRKSFPGIDGSLITGMVTPDGRVIQGNLRYYVDGYLPVQPDDPEAAADRYPLPSTWKRIEWQDALTGAVVETVQR